MGATADHFLKAGMSIAMIAFALYVAYTLWKRDYIKDFSIDVYIRNAFLSLYGLMIATTLFHLENIQNLIGGEISAMGGFYHSFLVNSLCGLEKECCEEYNSFL